MKNDVLYVLFGYDPEIRHSNGVSRKAEGQCKAILELGFMCDIMFVFQERWTILSGHSQIPISSDTINKKNLPAILVTLKERYEIIYARNYAGNKIYESFIKMAKSYGFKILVEIPTYPIVGEQKAKAKQKLLQGKIFSSVKSLFGGYYLQYIRLPLIGKYINRYILVSSDAEIKGCRCVRIENGIDERNISLRQPEAHSGIILLGVANVSNWHGYDRIILGLKAYYRDDHDKRIIFRVVGEGDDLTRLKKLAKKINISQYVQFVGKKFGLDLDNEFNNADIAVGTLGLHREKLDKASSLKAREYVARGIPFIITKAEVDDSKIDDYRFVVMSDDIPINLHALLNWYADLDPAQKISVELRDYALENYQWKNQMRKAFNGVYEE